MPAPGSVPSELAMVNLPEYVIEAPDVLVINAVIRNTIAEEAALAAGDAIKLVGYGAGTTFTATSTANVWLITDGIDHSVELITVMGAVHPTDILFG